MSIRIPHIVFLPVALILILINGPQDAIARVDHSVYAALLASHVRNGRVDYQGFKRDEPRLDAYLKTLAGADPDRLAPAEQMAFYINAYNAWTIKLILGKYPDLESIKDLGSLFQSPWKKKFVRINGEKVTLDHIEHEILRPKFKDPRVHFAVNCASISCPPLRNEPYTGEKLEEQLDSATADFINDKKSNYVEGDTLHVSRIFKWFGEDFHGDVKGFIAEYARPELAEKLKAAGQDLKVDYLRYDWSLNDDNRR